MAQVSGFVQNLTITPGAGTDDSWCCVWIGPTPTDATLLMAVQRSTDSPQRGSATAAMVEALASAQVNRREVAVAYGDNGSLITSVTVNP